MTPFIFLRGLRSAEHTVFSVADGQKFYRDPIHGTKSAYSSGQQVKRSLMDAFTTKLNVPFAPVTFNWTITKDSSNPKGKAEQGEAWSLCDPSFPDQLVGGYMKAEKDSGTVKRRSPLSISAMRPLHPLLGGMDNERYKREGRDVEGEPMSFDRSAYADRHVVNVFKIEEGKRVKMDQEEIDEWCASTENRTLGPKKWIEPQRRASGLFVYDVAIDLRTLFCVSTNQLEPEVYPGTIEKLKSEGWIEGENIFGNCLICPADQRKKIIDALADALINWRITSNQARTFSLMDTLGIAISDNANQVAYAIRAALDPESEREKAIPVIDTNAKAEIYLAPTISGFIKGTTGAVTALDDAKAELIKRISAFPFEQQIES